MGNWSIVVIGTGCHNNGKSDIDADLAAIEFVARLRSQGHTIESASFTHGGKVDLLEASKPAGRTCSPKINGRKYTCFPDVVTYEDLVCIAGETGRPSVIYTKARFGKQGALIPGQTVEATDDTIFDIVHTGNA